jgi:uncharacterized protein
VVPGSWRWEDWPIEGADERTYHLGSEGSLRTSPGPDAVHRLPYRPGAGAEAGAWWGELAVDQAPLDATCLVYETSPLPEDLVIIGFTRAILHASIDAPLAHFFARLSDVSPDGQITLVTGGGLNGAHRRSAEQPEPLAPGEVERFEVPMRFTSWVFSAGHRIRLAVSNHLWPMMWPTPHRMTMSLHVAASELVLPVVPLDAREAPRFEPPRKPPAPAEVATDGQTHPTAWQVDHSEGSTMASWKGEEESRFPWGNLKSGEYLRFKVSDARPDRAAALGEGDILVTLPGRTLAWQTRLSLRSDAEIFYYRFTRRVAENSRLIRERDWSESIPRDFQ